MATVRAPPILSILLFISSLLFISQASVIPQAKKCSYEAIYQFGDSISDVGNLIREGANGTLSVISHLPYGETFFNKPTGRCSNGRLMIDFLATSVGLPFLNPYLDKGASFNNGVNFAVAGATALDYSFFDKHNIQLPFTNSSLSVQLDWFRTHLNSLCSTQTECSKKLEKALFMVGEIGGNDYNYAFFQGKAIDEVQTYVPYVVNSIKDTAQKVIGVGARYVVVPGNFPIGCMPIYLTAFKTNDSSAYDNNFKCLNSLNNFARYHNDRLQKVLDELRQEHPKVVILYADYYNAFMSLLRSAPVAGLEEESMLKACCGSGGDYNFDASKMCGSNGISACPNPEQRVSWDGIHPTQKAYEYMLLWLVGMLRPIFLYI